MSNVLKHLTKMRQDIHFTVLTPELMPNFQFDNVEQVIYDVPRHPNEMRHGFDTNDLRRIKNTDI